MELSVSDAVEVLADRKKYVSPLAHDRSPVSPHPPHPTLLPPVASPWDEVARLVLHTVGGDGAFQVILVHVA